MARSFLSRNGVSFPVLHDADHSVASRYRPAILPSTTVIDEPGPVRHVHLGLCAGDVARLEREIHELL